MRVQQATFNHPLQAVDLAPLAAIAPQLVLVFGSVGALNMPGLLESLGEAFGAAALAGCTTAGEIGSKGVTDGHIVVTALHFDDPGLQVATTVLADMGDSEAAGLRLARQLDQPGLHDVLVLGQGVQINGSALIEGFRQGLPTQVKLSGGLAGDAGAFSQTFTLSRHAVSSDQIVAIGFFAPGLVLRHGSFHGWQPFGPERKVTRCDGNVLYELDGTPALEIYKRYLGEYAKDLPGSGLLFPFEMLGADRHALGRIRTILGIDEASGSLILAGDIDAHGYLRLMHASTDSLVDGARDAALAVGIAAGDPRDNGLALMVSCIGRKLVMGARVDEEVEAVSEVFGAGTQVTGFYSNGEISPSLQAGAFCHLHNQTMTITHLAERLAA
jgi:hypothetical protein